MDLKPWYKLVFPREDLREGRPLDASEFAVHLDQIRDKRAPDDYQSPERFFERTYLTNGLKALLVEVVRRLNGIKVETSAVFNMMTQFGGGKTHSLSLLYHLAKGGDESKSWKGVSSILDEASLKTIPEAAVAVFVGTEFDSIAGRGGSDGTPLRKTPWGEIAYQLGGEEKYNIVKEHDQKLIAPSSEVIRKLFPEKKPVLILMDELMNYVNRFRRIGLSSQFYSFIQNLSEEARANDNVVIAVSIPASELEMSAEDEADYIRLKKVLDRLGKPVIISAEGEIAEIIRRRLFEWGGLPPNAHKSAEYYVDWIVEHRQQIPSWFPVDNAKEVFASTYPFHPSVLSVFERKWQALPRFQRTRGILRLLALWVSHAFQTGFKGALKDPLITLGSAPLEDPLFRTALFEQLGEPRLEASVTTDITGRKESHAVRLDKEAVETIKKFQLHQRVAKSILFESNGGQLRTEATLPEIRLAVSDPLLDIGNVETALDSLTQTCYYLSVERNRYKFSLSPNLNKLLADRRASIQKDQIRQLVKDEIQSLFASGMGIERVFFPEQSNQIPDRAALTFVIINPDLSIKEESKIFRFIEEMTQQYGKSARLFKSALVWIAADNDFTLYDEARKQIAWEAIQAEEDELRLDETQKKQLSGHVKRAERDLRESIWRTYKNIIFLGKDNKLKKVDLGLVHSSAAENIVTMVLDRLRQAGEVERDISPNFLVRNWPPAFVEWNTKSVRDAFFASPLFPRLLNPETLKDTIVRGVESGILGYVGKNEDNKYFPFYYEETMLSTDIEFSDDMFIIQKLTAEEYRKNQTIPVPDGQTEPEKPTGDDLITSTTTGGTIPDTHFPPETGEGEKISLLKWSGEVIPQKWMNFYTKVLSRFVTGSGLKLKVEIEVNPEDAISQQKVEQTKVALRELGLNEDVETKD
ncbi:MAG: ATP-binding protein [Nitrospirota bacterium]